VLRPFLLPAPSRYFSGLPAAGKHWCASEDDMPEERQEMVALLFVMLTARLEDAHEIAATGQASGVKLERLAALARQLRETARDIIAIAEVIMILTDSPAH